MAKEENRGRDRPKKIWMEVINMKDTRAYVIQDDIVREERQG